MLLRSILFSFVSFKHNTMSPRRILLVLSIPLLVVTISGCNLFEDITKSDLEKNLSNLGKEWIVDSVRVREYGYIQTTSAPPQIPLVSDTLLPITKMNFLRDGDAVAGALIQTSVEKGVQVVTELRWQYVDYLTLCYPNPNIGLSDVDVIYTVVELTENNLHFTREENLVDQASGVRYGSLKRTFKMHK